MVVLAMLVSLTIVPPPAPQTAPPPIDVLPACDVPPELPGVHPMFRDTVREMWLRARTFRRQVARLSAEPALRVAINPWAGPRPPTVGARTRFSRRAFVLVQADVEVGVRDLNTVVEVIAHEVEHILEQLDGVMLSRSIGRQGVSALDPYRRTVDLETARAQSVGKTVAREFREASIRCRTVPR